MTASILGGTPTWATVHRRGLTGGVVRIGEVDEATTATIGDPL